MANLGSLPHLDIKKLIHVGWTIEEIATHFKRSPFEIDDILDGRTNRVYFIKAANGLTKIGHSKRLCVRLATLQMESPIDLELIDSVKPEGNVKSSALEAYLHRRYKEYHSHGEWFDLPDDVLSDAIEHTKGIKYSYQISVHN